MVRGLIQAPSSEIPVFGLIPTKHDPDSPAQGGRNFPDHLLGLVERGDWQAGDVMQGEGQQSIPRVFTLGDLDPGFFRPRQAAEAVEERGQPDFDERHTPGAGEVGAGGITLYELHRV
jgi:hypothetical protein